MGEQRPNGLAMLSINSDIARTLNYKHYRKICSFEDAQEDLNLSVEFENILYKLNPAY